MADREQRQKWRAYWYLKQAIKDGEVERPDRCENCGRPGGYRKQGKRKLFTIQAHHYMGYSKTQAINVIWLCPVCHAATKLPQPAQDKELERLEREYKATKRHRR